MTDLLERLGALDPATDDAIAEARRAARVEVLRDRIVEMPFDRVARWRDAVRRPGPALRRATVIVTALLVALAGIAIPVRWFGGGDEVVPGSDGDRLLTTVRDLSKDELRATVAIIDLDSGAVTPVGSGRAEEATPVWSHDGSRMAFVREAGDGADVVVADADGTNQRVLADVGTASWVSLTWSPDGSEIAVWGSGHDLQRIDVATGDVTRLRTPREIFVGGPIAWSPDGTTLAAVASPADDGFGLSYLYAMDVDGRNLRQLVEDPVLNVRTPPTWSPDGRTLVYEDATNELAAVDLVSRRSVQLTASANDSGTIVGISTAPTFSPDGTRIAFLRNDETGLFHAWVMDADGSNERQVTHETTLDLASLAWQPAPVPGGDAGGVGSTDG